MTTFETNHVVPLGSVSTLRIVNLLDQAYGDFLTWRSARRTQRELNRLSDQQLTDIGLIRGEIVTVADRLAARA